MNSNTMKLVARVAYMQKSAATSVIDEACDTKLEAESSKENVGGSPAAATEATNASDASTFDQKANKGKASSIGPANQVGDNADTTPRQKTASLADLLMKSAATQVGATKDVKLEEEAGKEAVGGGNGNEVQSAQESEKAPELKLSNGGNGGDLNLDKAASFKAGQIFGILKNSFARG
jgi:hypothetical protein